MFRKSKYLAAGGHDTRFWFHADTDLYLRLAETNCVAYVPEPLVGLASRETVPSSFALPQTIGPSSLPRSEGASLPGSSASAAGRNVSTLDVHRHRRHRRLGVQRGVRLAEADPGLPAPAATHPATESGIYGPGR